MKTTRSFRARILGAVVLMALLGGGAYVYMHYHAPSPASISSAAPAQRKILYWRDAMEPGKKYDHPGKSDMDMDLQPVYEDGSDETDVVKISPAVVQQMNVKTVTVGEMPIRAGVTTNGALEVDERKQYIVTTRVSGWIEKLYVNYTGERVAKGEKLFDIYSPELVAAEQELLTALVYNANLSSSSLGDLRQSGNALEKNAIEKLSLLNIPDADIQKIIRTKHIETDMTLYAQESGTVLQKNVIQGQKISAGDPLLKIADLSDLWLLADVYENELGRIGNGEHATLRFNFMPQKTFTGSVSFIYPTIDPTARTAKVRIEVQNRKGQLKPAMFANVSIAGKDIGTFVAVPEDCVIRTGAKNIVIVALGGGKFRPQQVTLGAYANGYYQVLEGLSAGTEIVSSAQFLIDSESNLKEAMADFAASPTGTTKGDTANAGNEKNSENSAPRSAH